MDLAESKELLRRALKKCVIRGPIVGSSGKLIENYVDCRRIATSAPYVVRIGALLYDEVVKFSAPVIGGMELGAVPLITAICYTATLQKHFLQSFVIRKTPKGHGTKNQIEGAYWGGARVVIVDDVITTGESVWRSIKVAEEVGMKVVGVIALLDREEKKCIPESYKLKAIFSLSQILE